MNYDILENRKINLVLSYEIEIIVMYYLIKDH